MRLLLPETHQASADLLAEWLDKSVLAVDPTPRFYLYTMQYRTPDGHRHKASGVIGALGLEPIGDRILGHEETMARTGVDRLGLLQATRANLDLIIALSPAPELPSLLQPVGPARFTVEADGVRHELYDLRSGLSEISEAIGRHPIAIADGHHRFTAALEYKAQHDGPGPWDAIMAFVVPAQGSGLEVRPIHRFFPTFASDDIGDLFDMEPVPPLPPQIPGSITMVTLAGAWLLTPREDALSKLPHPWRQASTAVARELLYPHRDVGEEDALFHQDHRRLIAKLAANPDGAALLMAPVPEAAVSAAAEQRIRFPRKTTLFTPKPRAGLVLRSF